MAKGYVFAAAGTAGHIYPAVAVAEALAQDGVDPSRVTFVTSRRVVENEIFFDLPYPRMALDVSGLAGRNPLRLARALWRIARATLLLRTTFSNMNPAAVVVFGGYISVAAALAARSLWVPIVVVETNSAMGRANRLAARLAARSFLAFESGQEESGVPLRSSVASLKVDGHLRRELVTSLGFDPQAVSRLVTVFGGSLGARRINDAVAGMLETDVPPNEPGTLYFVVLGRRDEGEFSQRLRSNATARGLSVAVVGYEDRLFAYMACSDAVICRSGSNTVAELAHFKVPSVLVPLPGAPGGHQDRNAGWLAERDHAVILDDESCNAHSMYRALSELLDKAQSFDGRMQAGAETASAGAAESIAAYLNKNFEG